MWSRRTAAVAAGLMVLAAPTLAWAASTPPSISPLPRATTTTPAAPTTTLRPAPTTTAGTVPATTVAPTTIPKPTTTVQAAPPTSTADASGPGVPGLGAPTGTVPDATLVSCPVVGQVPVVGAACNKLTDPLAGAVGGAIKSAFSGVAGAMADWATGMLNDLVHLVTGGVAPDFGAAGFRNLYAKVELIALMVAVGVFVLAIAGVGEERPARLAVVKRAALAAALAPIIPMLVDRAYHVTAALAAYVSSRTGNDIGTVAAKMTAAFTATGPVSAGLAFLLGLLGFLAAVAVWVVLAGSTAVIYFLTVFAPLALAVGISSAFLKTAAKVLGALAAAVATVFIVTTGLALAAALMASFKLSDPLILLEGVILLGLTAFAPFKLARLLGADVMEHGAVGHAMTVAKGAALAWLL